MATPFRLKRSAVANKRPGLTDLQLGELALNTYDGRLFAERDTGGVGIGTTIALLTPFTENYGGGSIYYNDGSVGIGTTNPTGKFEVFGGRIVGAATSNVIPFLYSDYSDLPSASSYHGAFAHVHSAGKGFFAHAGNWIEIVSKETNGTVGSGTERYNVGPTDLTTLNVSGISTLTGNVSFGSSAFFGDGDKINLGDNDDFQIFHHSNGTGIIQNAGSGQLQIRSNEIRLLNQDTDEDYAFFRDDGAVELYYDNSKKFETTSTGVAISGVSSATSYVGDGATLSGIVTSLVAGTNITLSGSTGQVTINSTGGGGTGGKFVSNNTGIHTLSNVGIGTTNASDDLTVRGDIAFTGRLKVTDLGLAGSNGQYLKSVGSGVTWASFPDARTSQTFTAADGQTTFTFTYNVNFIDVYVNGVKLATSEFTATNGTSVVLDEACFAGDIVEVISFNTTATGGGGSGGITDVVQDATPQLGGNLDLNSNSITGTGNVSISGIVTATSFVGGLTGNSSSATQLQTSRNIGGVAFNGTSDINLPGVNQTGTQSINTTGIVTASSLVGTGVSVVGVVTATSFVGSGANLTGVLTPTGNGIGLSGIVTSIIAGTNVTISGATGAVTINASGGGGGGSIAGISTTGTSHFANLQLTGITTGLNVSGVSTFAGNVSFGSSALFGDNDRILLGTGDDLQIYHDGNHSYIQDAGTGNLVIQSNRIDFQTAAGTAEMARFQDNGAVSLSFNGSTKFETTNTGAVVTGILTATSFSGSGANLTNLPAPTPADTDVQVTFDVSSNGSSAYRITGPGYSGADDNPDIYLVRGQRYRFINGTGSSHPFRIQSDTSGTAYTDGVSGSQNGTQDFNVQHDAPVRLYYQCTIHSGMIGNIYIVGGSDWRMTDVATNATPEIFTNLNVGIGTDNPYHELHIQGSGDTRALITSGGTGDAVMMFENASGNTWGHGIDLTNNNYVIAYNSTSDPSLTVDGIVEVTSAGNVGIGTDNPATNFKLDVNGDLSLGELGGTDNTYIDQKQNGQLDIINSGRQANSGSVRINKTNSISGDTTYFRDFEVYDGKDKLLFFVDGSSSRIGVGTDSFNDAAEVMRVQAISSQSNTLFTIKANSTSGSSILNFGDDDFNEGRIIYDHSDNSMQFRTNDAERLRITSAGMVDVKSGDLRVTGGEGVSAALYLIADQGDDNGDDWRIISNQDANDLTISNNDSGSFSDLFTFTKAGHLGVGHGSPQFGITLAQSANDIGAIGWEDGSNTKRASIRCNTSDDELQFHTGSSDSERMSIQSNGRVNMFHVYGTALSGTMRDVHIEDGGQLGYNSSTRDSKENISLLSNVDWLYQLQPSSFNYKKRNKNGEYTGEVSTELEYGLIAEDVESIAPELCFYDEVEGEMELRGIHYKKLIVPLLKALQEAQTRIETLETQNTAQQTQINDLITRVTALEG